MGTIKRHFLIHQNNFSQIKEKYPEFNQKFSYVELGNFLTDISQFRDPYAAISGKLKLKKEIEKKVQGKVWIFKAVAMSIIDAENWLDELMGTDLIRYGNLSTYFYHICRAITHLTFSDNIPKKQNPIFSNFLNLIVLPSKEVDRVFKSFYSQYYPHEHLDMPDFNLLESNKTKNESNDYKVGSEKKVRINGDIHNVGILRFLEDQIKYISEELTDIERNLLKNTITEEEKIDLFVKLGKILHPIEDFFFHSNFVELLLWNQLKNNFSRSKSEDEFLQWFYKNALLIYKNLPGYKEGKKDYELNQKKWERKLLRRLQFPIFEKKSTIFDALPSKKVSLSVKSTLYTGGFGSNDMFHTMINALENLQDQFIKYDPTNLQSSGMFGNILQGSLNDSLINSELVLIRVFFNKQYRETLFKSDKEKEQAQKKHVEQVQGKDYIDKINELHSNGFLNDEAKESFLQALEIDKKMQTDYPKMTESGLPGVGGFLIEFLISAQDEVNKSEEESKKLDTKSILKNKDNNVMEVDLPTDNGASGEEIGNHTLMGKDSIRSQPLYEDALLLATYASLTISTFIFDKIYVTKIVDAISESNSHGKLDWTEILNQVLRYPAASADMWEIELLNKYRYTNMLVVSEKDILEKVKMDDVKNNKIVPVFINKRQPLPTKSNKINLESKYHMLAEFVQKIYKSS